MDFNLSYYVELAMQGDSTAFEEIYKQTYWTVYYTCFSFLKNDQDAADTTQEVYITVMNSLSTLQDKEKFLYWLNRIAVNKCKNILLQKHPVTMDMDAIENVIPEENENFLPEDYITNQEKRQLVMDIIRTSLSDIQYQTVFLHYFNGFSVSEIAEIMECPVGTVTYRLSVARGKIKQAVTQYENINNEKLYSIGAVPLLACIFMEEFRGLYHVNPTPANIFNSVSTTTIIKEAAKKGAGGMLKTAKAKIIAGVAGIAVAGGIVTGIILVNSNKDESTPKKTGTTTESEMVNDTATGKTDSIFPDDTETPNDTQETEENTGSENASSIQPRNLDIKLDIVGDFSEGLAPVKENSKGNWGFIDTQGNLVIDYQFSSVYDFREGLACVQSSDSDLWGYIDTTGNVVIPMEYDHVVYFSDGIAHVVKNGTGYIIDKTGAVLAETEFESSGECSEGLINVKKDDKWGYIDEQGNLIIDCQYDVSGHFSEGLAWVCKDDRSGYIDDQGNVVIDFIYDADYNNSSEFTNGYAVVEKDGKYGMIDKQGNTVIDFTYDHLDKYTEDGLICAKKDGLYGYIDINGNTVIDFQYDDAYDFCDGLAFAELDNKYGFIDTAGNVVLDFIYDMNWTPTEYRFVDGITPVILNDQGCYIDINGNIIIGKITEF